MNRQRVIEVIDTGLSSYTFTEKHRHELLMQLTTEKTAVKSTPVIWIGIALIITAVIAAAVLFLSAFIKR
jgi:hypothetical protein